MTEAEKNVLLATPRDSLSDAICSLQWARTQVIDLSVRAKQCETNLDVALRLLQELAETRAK